jgi:hypothetical protein
LLVAVIACRGPEEGHVVAPSVARTPERNYFGAGYPQPTCDLSFLWRDAKAVLDDRHIIAHSIPLEDADIDGQRGLTIWNPRHGAETQITTSQLLSFGQDRLPQSPVGMTPRDVSCAGCPVTVR